MMFDRIGNLVRQSSAKSSAKVVPITKEQENEMNIFEYSDSRELGIKRSGTDL